MDELHDKLLSSFRRRIDKPFKMMTVEELEADIADAKWNLELAEKQVAALKLYHPKELEFTLDRIPAYRVAKNMIASSKTRYIKMSELQFNYEFEYKDGKPIASFAWRFDPDKLAWEMFHPDRNYLYKD